MSVWVIINLYNSLLICTHDILSWQPTTMTAERDIDTGKILINTKWVWGANMIDINCLASGGGGGGRWSDLWKSNRYYTTGTVTQMIYDGLILSNPLSKKSHTGANLRLWKVEKPPSFSPSLIMYFHFDGIRSRVKRGVPWLLCTF